MFRQQPTRWNEIAIKLVTDIGSIITRCNEASAEMYQIELRNDAPFRKANQDAAN